MVNFGLLAAEIGPVVWGTPPNFNGFRVLAALLHGMHSSSGRQPNFAALNRGRHTATEQCPGMIAEISSFRCRRKLSVKRQTGRLQAGCSRAVVQQ